MCVYIQFLLPIKQIDSRLAAAAKKEECPARNRILATESEVSVPVGFLYL